MLDDPVRAVRVEAARALAGAAEQGIPETRRAVFAQALAEYVAVQTYNADRPESRMNLGNLYAARRDAGAAIAEYRKALALDPTFLAAYANLADLYRARGAESEAEATLREGLARNPRTPVLHHALGLALARQKRTAESLRALRAAVQLAPDNARFAYVYAVALYDGGQPKDALKVLDTALTRHPYDRDVLSGLAYYSAQAGNRELALRYVKQLRELDPENAEYAQMAKRIEGAPQRQ
jgi:Flp pilus assembly protein TadD